MTPRRRRRGNPLPRALLAGAALIALCAFAWLRLPVSAAHAIFYVLAAWAAAAVLLFSIFLAVSVDDLGVVVSAAVRGAAPAMWFPPALLLLASSQAAIEAAGLALLAVAACLLAAQRAPGRRVPASSAAARAAAPRLFGEVATPQGALAGSRFPVTLGALAMQAGLWSLYVQYRLTAAALTALAAVLWTRSWLARDSALTPRAPLPPSRSLAAIALSLLLSVALAGTPVPDSVIPAAANPAAAGLFLESTRLFAHLARPDPAPAAVPLAAPERQPALVGPGIPGVILRSSARARPRRLPMAPLVPGATRALADSFTFPFTGDYHIFRTASGRLPQDAPVEQGTPLEAVFISATGSGTMSTEAVQPLIPPVDFSRCGEVRLTLHSGETFGADAALQLVTASGAENLGLEFFGLSAGAEETLTFAVPFSPHRALVNALRVTFGHSPGNGERSTKVAILRFALVPRSY